LVDIWRAFYRWLLDLGHGARSGALLEEVVIVCGINIFYMAHVLGKWLLAWEMDLPWRMSAGD
jgi:hypothetical protein